MIARAPERLRVGLLLNEFTPPAWVARIASEIQQSDFAHIELVVINAAPPPPELNWKQRWRERWQRSLYNRYKDWDRHRHLGTQPDAFAATDIRAGLQDVPVLAVAPIQTRFIDRFPPEAIASIRQVGLDVLFRFGFRILRGEILSAARCGIWSFHHGDNREYRGSAAGFWELYEGKPVTGSILQVLSEKLDGGQVLYRSWSATESGSLYASINPMYWKSAEFALRCLQDLHRDGWDWMRTQPDFQEVTPYAKSIYRVPGTGAMMNFLGRQAAAKSVSRLRAALRPQQRHWFMALRRRSGSRTIMQDFDGFQALASPPGRFWADPFLFESSGSDYLFFEDFSYSSRRGRIAWLRLGWDGPEGEAGVALETGGHLSYPFVFQDGQEIYMIPETRSARRVEIHRAVQFPSRWELAAVLLDNVEAVDATLHRQGELYWLFTNIAPHGGSSFDELHLFISRSLFGPWLPHPRSPVVSDVRRARPAGRLFDDGGRLIRPSQDCSRVYGGAIQFNQVLALSADQYVERPLHRIEPAWAPRLLGTHTYNRNERWEVLDGLRLEPMRRPAAARRPHSRSAATAEITLEEEL